MHLYFEITTLSLNRLTPTKNFLTTSATKVNARKYLSQFFYKYTCFTDKSIPLLNKYTVKPSGKLQNTAEQIKTV